MVPGAGFALAQGQGAPHSWRGEPLAFLSKEKTV